VRDALSFFTYRASKTLRQSQSADGAVTVGDRFEFLSTDVR